MPIIVIIFFVAAAIGVYRVFFAGRLHDYMHERRSSNNAGGNVVFSKRDSEDLDHSISEVLEYVNQEEQKVLETFRNNLKSNNVKDVDCFSVLKIFKRLQETKDLRSLNEVVDLVIYILEDNMYR